MQTSVRFHFVTRLALIVSALEIQTGPLAVGMESEAGKNGRFQPAKAVWSNPSNPGDRSIIVLSSPLVAEPVYYRHAWGRNPLSNLNADGIPLDTLRNDKWTVANMYEIYTGKKSATPNILGGVEFRDLRTALKAEDVKRRLQEAEAFIKEHQATSKAVQK